jgi:hypothetical protein
MHEVLELLLAYALDFVGALIEGVLTEVVPRVLVSRVPIPPPGAGSSRS